MDLSKLFEMQKVLDERINIEHPEQLSEDRIGKKMFALQVEIGELANELPEVFKFWSIKKNDYEKALKEYVDGLHFILSIGLDFAMDNVSEWFVESNIRVFKYHDVTTQFIFLNSHVGLLYQDDYGYDDLFYEYLALGEMLGFTWDQVEAAYMEKNAVNHARQAEGY